MKKELDYFYIEELYGGNQELFSDRWMQIGGCAAVTACDLSIYLAKYKGIRGISPDPVEPLTKAQYEAFAMEMKPYLHPRFTGIDRLDIYMDGYEAYLRERGCESITLEGFSGDADFSLARKALIEELDAGYPVPFLNLRHKDPEFEDFVWHWFLLTGYELRIQETETPLPDAWASREEQLLVKAVSYGEAVWFDFRKLWDTGYDRKGGMILLHSMD